MKSKLIVLALFFTFAMIGADAPGSVPAPIVSVIFSNESNYIENLFTLVQTGDYFGNKNAGAYYPQFIPLKGIVKRDTFTFDPGAIAQGPNVYPFMFTYKGGVYYLLFVTSKILEEKTDFPFFATIIKVVDIQEKDNSAQIETIANLYFNQNDTLALALQPDRLAFGNVTNQTMAGFVNGKPPTLAQRQPVKLTPRTAPKKRKVQLKPTSMPKPVVSVKTAVKSKRPPLLSPLRTPAPAKVR